MTIKSKEDLINHLNHGHSVDYLFFWGHQKPKSGIASSCFSQWYESPFLVESQQYPTAEHYMMACKADLFADQQSKHQILAAASPGDAKKLGRNVQGFNDELWLAHRFEIVVTANLAKFSQNADLKAFLLSTDERILVEASPVDRIWGIGLAADDPKAMNPYTWRGLNLLGFALMYVRDLLRA